MAFSTYAALVVFAADANTTKAALDAYAILVDAYAYYSALYAALYVFAADADGVRINAADEVVDTIYKNWPLFC